MAFKDSGEEDGKKVKKTKKSKSSSNGRGSLVLVLVVLWLIGLTAAVAFFNLPMGGGAPDLENRVSALEQRAGQARGAISPPGVDDLGTLTDRVNELEERLNAGGAATASAAASGASGDAGAVAGDCPCDRILGRLDRLENRVATAGAGDGGAPAAAAAENETAQARSAAASDDAGDESAEAPAARSASPRVARKSVRPGTRKPQPPRNIPGVEVRSFGRDGRPRAPMAAPRTAAPAPRAMPAPSPPVYARDGNLDDNLQQSTQTESVYDITRRMAPMYGYTEGEMRRMEQLAPGAAIYPGNNGGYVGSVLSN
jgi:hypothetical protein